MHADTHAHAIAYVCSWALQVKKLKAEQKAEERANLRPPLAAEGTLGHGLKATQAGDQILPLYVWQCA